jgi:delta11-fatty-acid desaturase
MVIITKIHNKYYNVENFQHPGGDIAIWHSYGRDSTAMFEMYHPFVNKEKLQNILEKYEVSAGEAKSLLLEREDNTPQFEYDTDFSKELKQEVNNYFQKEAIKNNTSIRKITKASTNRWVLIGVLNFLRLLSIFWWLNGSIYGLIAFPVFSWLGLSNVFHDACHFSLSDNWKINRFFSYFGYDLTTPLYWYYQHNIGHHAYTNIKYKDVDLYHGSYFARDSKYIKYKIIHKFQIFTVWVKWILTYYGLVICVFIRSLIENKYNDLIPKYNKFFDYIEIKDRILLIIYFIIRYVCAYYWFNKNFLYVIIPTFIYSFLFMVNSQITHLHEDCFHNEKDWYKHQTLTSTNHSIGSTFNYIFSGGLNYQIEHHLFPGVNHCHYPYIQPIVEKVCEKHKITYKKFNGYYDAFVSYFKHIFNLSYDQNIKIK